MAIQKLSNEINNELLEIKGFSERNIGFMLQLYKEYELVFPIGKQTVSQLPWGHDIVLNQRIKDYSSQT